MIVRNRSLALPMEARQGNVPPLKDKLFYHTMTGKGRASTEGCFCFRGGIFFAKMLKNNSKSTH
jgi:hypothetical protein